MGYSEDPEDVRVDFFKESGKWYATEAIKWTGSWEGGLVRDIFKKLLWEHLHGRLQGMTAVCLHPYHKHEVPILVRVPYKKPDDRYTK